MTDTPTRRVLSDVFATLSEGLQAAFRGSTGTEAAILSPPAADLAVRSDDRPLSALLERISAVDDGISHHALLGVEGRSAALELRAAHRLLTTGGDIALSDAVDTVASASTLLRALGDPERADDVDAAVALLPPTDRAEPSLSSASAGLAEAPVVEFVIDALHVQSYAQARAGIPAVHEITVAYQGPELRGAAIEISVASDRGPLSETKTVNADLDGTTSSVLQNVDVRLDPARMLEHDSPSTGAVSAVLRSADGGHIGTGSLEVQVLAADQWLARPEQLALELLAAFVQPHSDAIGPLLLEASDRLRDTTGDSSLDGYQQESPTRVDAIVEAVYESIRARDVRYAEPPASWGLSGQRIRTPHDVLVGRIGTCLDTTTTLAAVLEQVGLNSALWLYERHVFLGWWRTESALEGVTSLDAAEMRNYVDLEIMGVVETTAMTGGADSLPFADAVRRPHLTHLSRPETFRGSVDIRQARLSRIYPLPSRSTSEDGTVVVREYQVASARDPLRHEQAGTTLDIGEARVLPPRVSQWKNALLDLSLRNRLINFGAGAGLPLAVPAPALPQFEDMVNEGNAITLLPMDRVPDVERARGIRSGTEIAEAARITQLSDRKSVFAAATDATYATRLRTLAYKARTIAEETGANNLYLAFGMLRWRIKERDLRSPLVLVPVRLEEAGRGRIFRLVVDEAGESTPNFCLLEKLRVEFGLDVPGLANPVRDGAGVDLPAAFRAMREALVASRLPFTVEDSVELSILQFAKYRLWKDLDENWESLSSNALVSHLIHTPTEPFGDSSPEPGGVDLDALGNAVPVPADSSQLEAISDAAAGRTFVLEGPPGTGKSQTITNLLAHALTEGKRVLFVAEKRAALDVVKDRLDAVGLGPFSLDLHDKGARPNAVREQLRAAVDAVGRTDETTFATASETARTSRESLRRYAERLHSPNPAGLSLYDSRVQLLASSPDVPPLPVPALLVARTTPDRLEEIRTILRRLPETADLAHPRPMHPWGFVGAAEEPLDPVRLHEAARAFDAALIRARDASGDPTILAALRSPAAVDRWATLARAPRLALDRLDALRDRIRFGELTVLKRAVEEAATPAAWFDRVAPTALDGDTASVHAEAVAADASGFFGRKKRRRAALARFGTNLRVDPKSISPRDVSTLTSQVAATAADDAALRERLRSLDLVSVPANWSPHLREGVGPVATSLAWADWVSSALAADEHGQRARDALRAFYASSSADAALAEALATLSAAWRDLVDAARTPASAGDSLDALQVWATEGDVASAWEKTRDGRDLSPSGVAAVSRWIAFVQELQPLTDSELDAAHALLRDGTVPADLAALAFDKGIAATSVDERQEAQAFSAFDVTAHERTIARFLSGTATIREELPRRLPAEIIGRRQVDASYDGGRMGELKRQLARKKGGLSVRTLFESYGDLILQIAPCALMSPESVARFFPATAQMFDIVVFDEASQIRVADAVGAMGRARSVVVVGDSKQMPPTSFAEVSTEPDETQSDSVVDEESILTECVQAGVPRKWLSWHYRSQDESLILFSNHAYYENRLSSFPAPWRTTESDLGEDHGVSLVRVAGRFERSATGSLRRTNPVEATAIVEEVERRFAASPDSAPSVGIVTFNAQQRSLIENMLREAPDERIAEALSERDGLFVKNLENVQGDERDVILFSVAFSENDRGIIPLNFGPLTRAGGERRLNVAITRARRRVVLFASFEPSQLRAEETTSVGIKHLKGYLELAATGTRPTPEGRARPSLVDHHREEIAAELRARGLAVRTDVGLSDFRVDLAVGHPDEPDRPLVAILLDGVPWRERRTVSDRDGLPVSVLRGLLKWPGVERIWLPEWLQDSEAVVSRIQRSVADARQLAERRADEARSRHRRAAAETTSRPVRSSAGERSSSHDDPEAARDGSAHAASSLTPAVAGPRHSLLRAFVAWEPRTFADVRTLDRLPSPPAAESVRAAIGEVVAAEGPIHETRLVKLVAAGFGLSRVSERRAEAILRCLPPGVVHDPDSSCLWPAGIDPATWREARRSEPGDGRDLDHIPLIEIANAMAIVAEIGGGMTSDELKREALAVFGLKRLTSGIGARLDEARRAAVGSGRLDRDPQDRYAPPTSPFENSRAVSMRTASPANDVRASGNIRIDTDHDGAAAAGRRARRLVTEAESPAPAAFGFATIDFETTGLVPERTDRAIEVAVVHSDPDGTITGQWETLINPARDLGRQDIHGISAREILRAPAFGDIAAELVELLSGRVIVAHNASFDLRFLTAELGRMGYVSDAPFRSMCTMQLARRHLGGGLSLADCCAAFDIDLTGAHRASADAFATAQLLASYIASTGVAEWTPHLRALPRLAPIERPRAPWYPRSVVATTDPSFLERIAARVPDVSSDADQASYLALVERCLLDRHLSEHEKDALVAFADRLGIGHATARDLHVRYFHALTAVAWSDGVLTPAERLDLELVATLLSLPPEIVADALLPRRRETAPALPVPEERFHLRPGDLVTLTGEMRRPRSEWERLIAEHGLVPKDAVTKKVRVVVAADPDSLSGKARKAREYGIPVVNEEGLARLLDIDG